MLLEIVREQEVPVVEVVLQPLQLLRVPSRRVEEALPLYQTKGAKTAMIPVSIRGWFMMYITPHTAVKSKSVLRVRQLRNHRMLSAFQQAFPIQNVRFQ